MTEPSMTNRKHTDDKQGERQPFRARNSGRIRFLLIATVIIFVLGCQRGCPDERAPSISCRNITLFIEPGTCVLIPNPCREDGRWVGRPNFDGFRLCPTAEQQEFFAANGNPLSLVTTRTGEEVTRSICIAEDSPHFTNFDIPFIYGRIGSPQYGTASLVVTVAPRFTLNVTATPTNIAIGESCQLLATARGGTPPYFYSWVPATALNDNDIAAPTASPVTTTEYRVRVIDSGGQERIGSVTISVGMALTVTANPQQINVGDASLLLANPVGGTPPYTYSWTPAATLDDPSRQDPLALPTVTTTYQVTVRDSTGVTRQGSATVFVGLGLTVTANPLFIMLGEGSQLNAIGVGGTPPYTFEWTPANTLDRPQDPNPIATPTTTTMYQVTMRDSTGTPQAGSVLVTVVDSSPPPTASFVFTIAATTLNLDASASTGNIVTYTWDLGWTSANPDRITASPTTSFMFQEFNRGIITLTVTSAGGRIATTTRNFP